MAVARVDDLVEAGVELAPAWMSDAERRRCLGLAGAAWREFVAARALLRDLLQVVTGVAAEAWTVSAEPGTAPLARAADATQVHISLSHRLGWVAAAVADAPVGVDLECERPARSDPAGRAALMLSPSEMPTWQALPTDAQEAALLTRWTAKEAWFKASPPGEAPWDFRRVAARPCAAADANVRTWAAPPLHVAVCAVDADELMRVECHGIDFAPAASACWRLART